MRCGRGVCSSFAILRQPMACFPWPKQGEGSCGREWVLLTWAFLPAWDREHASVLFTRYESAPHRVLDREFRRGLVQTFSESRASLVWGQKIATPCCPVPCSSRLGSPFGQPPSWR